MHAVSQNTCLADTVNSFKVLRSRTWKLWENCMRKVDVKDVSCLSLSKLQEEAFEFLEDLVSLTHLLQTLQRENEDLACRVSHCVEKLLSLRKQKSELEARLSYFIELGDSSLFSSVRLQPVWKLLDSSQVEEFYGPRIAGLVTRTLQTENQSTELELARKRYTILCLGRQLQKSQFCAFYFFRTRHCAVYALANTLYNSEISVDGRTQRVENIGFRLDLKNPNITSSSYCADEKHLHSLCACLFFTIQYPKSWSVSIEESLSYEPSAKCPLCCFGILQHSKDTRLFQIRVEPKISEENIGKLRNLLFELLEKDMSERGSLVISEFPGIFSLPEENPND
ncbi:hypothetical protein GAYE_SCF48G5968 [Galdieria yellowstonensis]|uniref:Uncharacterized protein n=1 Tax=Galdieria yellowstonensis TaxID=3028027 RepID=A0AAV9IL39_9RHOD|nr:hypothetical protein GAYE_SCF48G5968 [Galdieria yellowstonensis]